MKKWYKLCPYCGEEIREIAKNVAIAENDCLKIMLKKNKTGEISNWNNPYNAKNNKVIVMTVVWMLFLLYSLWELRMILFGIISLIVVNYSYNTFYNKNFK